MGAWGVSSFENDDAIDWLEELLQSDNFLILYSAFEMVDEDYLECPDGCNALAAAEVVAALGDNCRDNMPEPAKQWVANHKAQYTEDLSTMALGAIDRVTAANSELNELWQESDEYSEWLSDIKGLKAALAA